MKPRPRYYGATAASLALGLIVLALASLIGAKRPANAARRSVESAASTHIATELWPSLNASAGPLEERRGSPAQARERSLIDRVRQLADQPPTQQRDKEIQTALRALAALNPHAAIDLARENFLAHQTVTLLSAVLKVWAHADPANAWQWTLENPVSDASGLLLSSVMDEIARQDATCAVRLAGLVEPNSRESQAAYAAIFAVMGERGNFDAALNAAQTTPNDASRLDFFQRIVGAWSSFDPAAAANWAQRFDDPPVRDRLLVELSQRWFEAEPLRAAELTLQVQNPELRRAALTEAFLAWFNAKPADATRWVDGLAPHADLDYIAGIIAATPLLATTRTDVALGWAESIVNDDLRLRSLTTIVAAWLERDRPAALRYLQTSATLTPREREILFAGAGTDAAQPKG